MWLKIKQEGLGGFWSMFPLTRAPFWNRLFEPQPNVAANSRSLQPWCYSPSPQAPGTVVAPLSGFSRTVAATEEKKTRNKTPLEIGLTLSCPKHLETQG